MLEKDIRVLIRIVMIVVILFILNKIYIRPIIIAGEYPSIMKIFVLSIPNFYEAVCGSFMLTVLGITLNMKVIPQAKRISENSILSIAITFSSIYVITQELKIHNIGGRNVYDPYDLIFSIAGISVSAFFLFGYLSKLQDK